MKIFEEMMLLVNGDKRVLQLFFNESKAVLCQVR